MEQPEISKTEYITREEVRILINRFEQKISQLEEKLEALDFRLEAIGTVFKGLADVADKKIEANKQQIGGLYNIQLYGKPN